ncbi:MAG: SDR family NAD(P)-dependent oxidoreductase, partial [Legionellales bacterium]
MAALEGKIALVTGASRGIGQAVAHKLAQQGAFVYGTATTEQGAAAINAFFEKNQLTGEGVVLDVTNSEQIHELMEVLSNKEHSPSILVNNAGITADNLLLRMDDDEWYNVI